MRQAKGIGYLLGIEVMSERSQTVEREQLMRQSPLHLLIVEDVPEDVELMAIALESAGVAFTYDIADTASKCQQLLQERTCDAVLSDYRLPRFNGLRVLELLQQSGQEIPFILVTDSLGEEAAVECIRAGMTDYVLKDRLFCLPMVLARALQEFELRRQQKAAIAKIQRQAWREAIVNRIVQVMRETLMLDEVLQTTVDQLQEVLQVSRCLIVQPDSQGQLRVKYLNRSATDREDIIGNLFQCPWYDQHQDRLLPGQPICLPNIDLTLLPEVYQCALNYGFRSVALLPLLYQQAYLGLIVLHQCDRERDWTEDELVLVKAIADHCAIAIHQTRLYQQAQTELAERQRAESELRKSEQRFRALIENATDIILILDAGGVVRYASPSARSISSHSPEQILGKNYLDIVHPDDQQAIAHLFDKAIENPGPSQPAIECRLGSWQVLEVVATNLLDDPAVAGIVFNCHDITQRKQAEEQLRHGAFYDQLTGLANRALLLDRLEQAIQHYQRRKGEHFAILFLDLDHFKVINDSLGHLVGDRLLVAIARRLEKCQRAGDTIARLGGDEFVILLENIREMEEAIKVAERIHQTLSQPFILDSHEVFTSASIGIALSSTDYDQPEQLLRDADTAMYYAKERGNSRHAVFEPSIHDSAVRQLHLESDLRRAKSIGSSRKLA